MASSMPSVRPKGKGKDKRTTKEQDQNENPNVSRRAKPQGPREAESASRYHTLPDLRFLNHNKPPVTAASILSPAAVNSNNIQQFQALREAEAWYAKTTAMLQERLELSEKMQTGLKQLNTLLAAIQATTLDSGGSVEPGSDTQREAGASKDPGRTKRDIEEDLRVMEEAVEAWLRDVRVSRAKWIAGGTDMERRIGLK